jgi:hypothetical protein
MAEPIAVRPRESDQSSDEKGHAQHELEEGVNPLVADLPPDPDRHLSPAERASIVSLSKDSPA